MLYPILIAILLVSCAESKQAAPRTPAVPADGAISKGGSDIRLGAESWEQIEDINERYTQYIRHAAAYTSIGRVNQALCGRLEVMRQKCVVKKPLMKDVITKTLACDGTLKEAISPAQFSVEVVAPAGASFTLEANDLYTSTPFQNGTSNITFTSPSDDNKASPTFAAVYKLVVKSSAPLPSNTSLTITLKVDGEAIITNQTVSNTAGDLAKFVVDLRPVFGVSISPACRVSDDEYAAMIQSATVPPSETEGKVAIDIKTLKSAPTSDGLKATLNEVSEKLGEMTKKIESEVGRNARLRSELMTGSGEGCHLRKPIERLGIELLGPGRGRTYVDRRQGRLTSTTEASSGTLQVDIGNIRIDIPDTQNPFGSIFEVDRDVSQTDIIAGIDRLIFKKRGLKFSDTAEPCNRNEGVLDMFGRLISNPTCYRIYEENTMHITGIRLFANNKLIFEDDKLDVRLNRNQLSWTYNKSIQSNEQWIKEVVKKTDCDDTH